MQDKMSQHNSRQRELTITILSVVAGIMLLVTGGAKIVSSFGRSEILVTTDPIFHVPFGRLLVSGGLLEITVAIFCLYRKNKVMSMTFLAWLSSLLLLYRVGLKLIGWHQLCPCVGNLTDALNIPPQTADFIMDMVLTYLLVVSYGTLFWFPRLKWRSQSGLPSSKAPASGNELPSR